ncbi:unnamed protein product [Peronospora effusa]|nr:unnamed protein product [Peronospora effusa]
MASIEFISMWQSIAEANEHYFTLVPGGCGVDDVSGRLGHNNAFFRSQAVHRREDNCVYLGQDHDEYRGTLRAHIRRHGYHEA